MNTHRIIQVLENHIGNDVFQNKLETSSGPEELVARVSQWVWWNTAFGGAVAGLSSVVWDSANLFGGTVRSSKIASLIFFAARDEFGDQGARSTHPELAGATLLGLTHALNVTIQTDFANPQTVRLMTEVVRGYRARGASEETELWKALGFHFGSETLADAEFRTFSSFLEGRYPDVVRWMKTSKVEGKSYSPWSWIEIHAGTQHQTGVEIDHAESAATAIELALKYYKGSESPKICRQWVEEGLAEFCQHQTTRMQML
jgi:hypothetical protein